MVLPFYTVPNHENIQLGNKFLTSNTFHSMTRKNLYLKQNEDPSRLAKIKIDWQNTISIHPYDLKFPIYHDNYRQTVFPIPDREGRKTPPGDIFYVKK